jgi:hypothetical protein
MTDKTISVIEIYDRDGHFVVKTQWPAEMDVSLRDEIDALYPAVFGHGYDINGSYDHSSVSRGFIQVDGSQNIIVASRVYDFWTRLPG